MQECGVEGCDRARYARQEVCEPHYRRFRRTGSYGDTPIGAGPPGPKACLADGCGRVATERGLCHGHYLRVVRTGSVGELPLSRRRNDICTVGGCDKAATARGLCPAHRTRRRTKGTVDAHRPVKKVAGTGFVHHGYRVVPVAPEDRWLVGGKTSELEHRLAMARRLGRPLTPDESVHHKNGNRADNSESNLELWTRWQPAGQRVCDQLEWALELLHRYAPHALARQLPLMLEVDLGSPEEIRTPATALRGRRPRPLDDGALETTET